MRRGGEGASGRGPGRGLRAARASPTTHAVFVCGVAVCVRTSQSHSPILADSVTVAAALRRRARRAPAAQTGWHTARPVCRLCAMAPGIDHTMGFAAAVEPLVKFLLEALSP